MTGSSTHHQQLSLTFHVVFQNAYLDTLAEFKSHSNIRGGERPGRGELGRRK